MNDIIVPVIGILVGAAAIMIGYYIGFGDGYDERYKETVSNDNYTDKRTTRE